MKIGISESEISKIVKIIKIFFPDAKIYFFGSRARGDFNERSDIDIAIDAGEKFGLVEKGQIIGMFDMLIIPQKIDLVDFHRAPKTLQENILKEGILWKNLVMKPVKELKIIL